MDKAYDATSSPAAPTEKGMEMLALYQLTGGDYTGGVQGWTFRSLYACHQKNGKEISDLLSCTLCATSPEGRVAISTDYVVGLWMAKAHGDQSAVWGQFSAILLQLNPNPSIYNY